MGFRNLDAARWDKRPNLEAMQQLSVFFAKLVPRDSKFLSRLVIAKIGSVAPVTTHWQACSVGSNVFYERLMSRHDDKLRKFEL